MSSESSVTSSQLDDIPLCRPAQVQYELPTEVRPRSLDASLAGQRRQPEDNGTLAAPANLFPKSLPISRIGNVEQWRNEASLAGVPDNHSPHGGRMHVDGAAAPDSFPERSNTGRVSPPYSDASETAVTPMRETSGNSTVTIDLLSPAFILDDPFLHEKTHRGFSLAEIVSDRAVTGLGIDPGHIRFYQINEVQPHELCAPGHYAVFIDRSGFSLHEMEHMLAANSKLQETSHMSTASLNTIQGMWRKMDEERSQLYLDIAEQKAEVARLQERCKQHEESEKYMSQHYARLDKQRKEEADRTTRSVDEMKRELSDLKGKISNKDSKSGSGAPLSARRNSTQSRPPSARGGHQSESQIPHSASARQHSGLPSKSPRALMSGLKSSDATMEAISERCSTAEFKAKFSEILAIFSAPDARKS